MSATTNPTKATAANAFVLFPLGGKRFALPAAQVTELARPDRLQQFPHTTPLVGGVLVRRGRIVPVLDVAQVLLQAPVSKRRFYLIATRRFGNVTEPTAIPVSGECLLASAQPLAPAAGMPNHISGLLAVARNSGASGGEAANEDEVIEILDLDRLAEAQS